MMKATDLMIDDWVIVYEKAMPVKAKVEGVHGNFATVLGHARIVDNGGNTPYVLPIHLNSDILEKNGFEIEIAEYTPDWTRCILNPNFFLEDRLKGFYHFNGNNLAKIQYVHELQHALKLCGIDKEIIL